MKDILYYTSSTIGDDRSSENRPKGPSFLLMKRLAEKNVTRDTRAGGGEGDDTGAMVNETRQQLKRQYTRHEIDLPTGREVPTRKSCKKELVATMLLKKKEVKRWPWPFVHEVSVFFYVC
jgi:hypothetical protein